MALHYITESSFWDLPQQKLFSNYVHYSRFSHSATYIIYQNYLCGNALHKDFEMAQKNIENSWVETENQDQTQKWQERPEIKTGWIFKGLLCYAKHFVLLSCRQMGGCQIFYVN